MKLKKLASILVMITALLSFSTSAFAEVSPITDWSVTNYTGTNYCKQLSSVDTDDYYAHLFVTSGTSSCDMELTGSTQVSNINQLLIDWNLDIWDSGSGDVYLSIQYDGGGEFLNIGSESVRYGTAAIGLSGYSGPVWISLNSLSSGGRRVDATLNIYSQ
ncbi:hypothetical protein [Paenibacillus hamazuiensis]|uniref:hypothetical protein n=1 Tax=Paenibacillus hamazuiensis TaxID=2936508 RepID=UPI00200E9F98|nr:hypothetical protein [Paenibacillus hamazuiensis]